MSQRFILFLIAFIGLSCAVLNAQPAQAETKSILGERSVKTYPISHLPRWQTILSENLSDTYNQNPQSKPVNVQTWNAFTETLRGSSKLRQLLKVNMWFEQFPYKQDNWVYKKNDYWATPREFLTKGGDCEDYAIIKYMTLRKLGFSANDMRIAFVYDVYSGTDHAFLLVNHNGAEFVLDNREKVVVSRYMKNRYKPHFAFNENAVWTFNSPLMAKTIRQNQGSKVLPGNR